MLTQTKCRSSVKKRSSSIQTKESTSERNLPDLISALPDSLLLDILSLLDMKDVMGTSLLSKRWRYLWKFIPCLCFKRFSGRELTNFIDRCLFHHEGSKIRKLDISFGYGKDRHALLVDSWIHFAIRRKVEDFKLFCLDLYKLPRSLYFCETLTSLTLSDCNLNLPQSFQLGSLKKLSLQLLELSSDSIEHLSSSCPLLEEIHLINCNCGRELNIVITNQHVKRLELSDHRLCKPGSIKINAPTLLLLRIYECDPNVMFHFEELGSLISAEIIADEVCSFFYECCIVDVGDETNYLEGLLYDLRHVRRLKLCSRCLEVLSVLSIRKMFRLDPFSISATSVELQTTLTKWELPGISYLLKNCSNLENLEMSRKGNSHTILPEDFMNEYDFEEEGYWESVGIALPSILQNIKIIKLNGNVCSNESFVRFLLKNSKVLERMVISTPKRYFNNFKKLFELTQRLIVFPRSSPNAEVFIT